MHTVSGVLKCKDKKEETSRFDKLVQSIFGGQIELNIEVYMPGEVS